MEEGITLSEIFKVALKNIKLEIIFIIIGIVSGLFVGYMVKPTYIAKGSVLVLPKDGQQVDGSTQSATLVATINSFIQRDFVLKETIEELSLGVDIETFPLKYKLTNEVDYNFINISCSSDDYENNILIINKIIEKLINYQKVKIAVDATIIPTEYASYNITKKTSNLIYITSGLILFQIIFLGVILYKILFSNKIQTKEELERICKEHSINYLKVYKENLIDLVLKIKINEMNVLNNIPDDLLLRLKNHYKKACFIEYKDLNYQDYKKLKKDYENLFIISYNDFIYDSEVDKYFEFLNETDITKSSLIKYKNNEKINRFLVDLK